jgi:hypothetical protein
VSPAAAGRAVIPYAQRRAALKHPPTDAAGDAATSAISLIIFLMPIIDSWLGVVVVSLIAFVAPSTVLKPDWTRFLSFATSSTVLTHIFFVLVLSCAPLIRVNLCPALSQGSCVALSKACGVLILGLSQHLRLPTHPMLLPPGTAWRAHISSFVPVFFTALATGFFLQGASLTYGYPASDNTSLFSAFTVVFCVLFVYLLLFADLIRKGYSRQWANVALAMTLICIDTHAFHLNPIVTLVSAVAYGASKVYAAHLAAIAAAVIAARAVEGLKASAAARVKQH